MKKDYNFNKCIIKQIVIREFLRTDMSNLQDQMKEERKEGNERISNGKNSRISNQSETRGRSRSGELAEICGGAVSEIREGEILGWRVGDDHGIWSGRRETKP